MNNFIERCKPEVFIVILIIFGTPLTATIGLDYFNNRYIAVPYIIIVSILYILLRKQENDKQRIGTD